MLRRTTQEKFPYIVLTIVAIWTFLGLAYLLARWRAKSKIPYVIPRVFVLCSPRTVQFHYELILRVGLASSDFNPDKHDIDITVQGLSHNEVIPITRLNTKTLLDESLITSLSIVAYRLVEMPALGGLLLKHSGPFRSWVYAYDFTVIDLSTNREFYYSLNQYIGSLNKVIPLDEPNKEIEISYPIDDVPLPSWTTEDIFLFLYTVINHITLSVSLMPINCHYSNDIVSVLLTAIGGGSLVFFMDWLLYYHLRWSRERKEYFNQIEPATWCSTDNLIRIGIAVVATVVGIFGIYLSSSVTNWRDAVIWVLTALNSGTIVIGVWNVARQVEAGEAIVLLGLKFKGIESVAVGMKYSDLVTQVRSASASDEGGSTISNTSKVARSFGPRSSVKSFGFKPRYDQKQKQSQNSRVRPVTSTLTLAEKDQSSQIVSRLPSSVISTPISSSTVQGLSSSQVKTERSTSSGKASKRRVQRQNKVYSSDQRSQKTPPKQVPAKPQSNIHMNKDQP